MKPLLDAGNVDKTMAALPLAILGMDIHFFELLPSSTRTRTRVSGICRTTCRSTSLLWNERSLQGAYFMLAAGAGAACADVGLRQRQGGAAFFAGTTIKSNFLCNLGYGDAAKSIRARRLTLRRRISGLRESGRRRIEIMLRRRSRR